MTTDTAPSEHAGGFGEFGAKKEFPCDNCGAKLTFSIGAQSLKCDHCGHEKKLEFAEGAKVNENDLQNALAGQVSRRAATGHFAGTHEVKCSACGATVVFDGSLTASACAYCDAPIQRENAHAMDHRIPLDGICTFQIEKDVARVNLTKWVKSRWFAPNAWKARGVDGKFDGVYMPFFTFDAMTFTRYTGMRGDAYWETHGSGNNKRRVRKVRWSPAAGSFQRFFDDVLIPALKSLPQQLLRGLEPWPLEKVIPFSDAALSGKRAHTYEMDLKESLPHAKERIETSLKGDVKRRIGGDEQRITTMDVNYSAMTYKHLLLPVWILAYRYMDKPYRVVVNAMTGQVHGERPWSKVKIALAVIAGLIIGGVIWYVASQQQR
jgi:DNA-directed RNA polymerase subunit RPC12/RpoP